MLVFRAKDLAFPLLAAIILELLETILSLIWPHNSGLYALARGVEDIHLEHSCSLAVPDPLRGKDKFGFALGPLQSRLYGLRCHLRTVLAWRPRLVSNFRRATAALWPRPGNRNSS